MHRVIATIETCRARMARSSAGIIALGSIGGALVAAAIAPRIKSLFHPPDVGVGLVTVIHYPKSWDYAVVVLLIGLSFLGGLLASMIRMRSDAPPEPAPSLAARGKRIPIIVMAIFVFVSMGFVHDHPYSLMDPFHEGETLTPALLLKEGWKPYSQVFFLHGIAFDGGLAALVLGDPPSPLRVRRMNNLMTAAGLALLVPLAAELSPTVAGVALATLLSICTLGAGMVPVFPYRRLAPLLVAAIGLIRYARTGKRGGLYLAFAASTLGVLWSLDVGMYALAGTTLSFVAFRILRLESTPAPLRRVAIAAAIAVALPLLILLAVRGDLVRFFVDSFLIIPGANNVSGSLPAPAPPGFAILGNAKALGAWLVSEEARYYLPPVFDGFLAVLALQAWARGHRDRAAQLVVVAIFSMFLFRSAAGRCGWSHKRFALPLLGMAISAFAIEPLLQNRESWRRAIAYALVAVALLVPLWGYLEISENVTAAVDLAKGWKARQSHEGMVPFPFRNASDIYTDRQNAADLTALNEFIQSRFPAAAPIFDFSNERALYYLLERKPATRCLDIMTMTWPSLTDEAIAEMDENPPACVIVKGYEVLYKFDQIPNDMRAPRIAKWIDEHYPTRTKVGRFIVATK